MTLYIASDQWFMMQENFGLIHAGLGVSPSGTWLESGSTTKSEYENTAQDRSVEVKKKAEAQTEDEVGCISFVD